MSSALELTAPGLPAPPAVRSGKPIVRDPALVCSWSSLGAVALYALAMAWVESAVVFYLRTMFQRLVPYQPNPLPIVGGLGMAEIVRELATLIMLLTVGWLAGRTPRGRLACTLLAFGIWDIAYYVWLIPMTQWPTSLTDWDILFLVPLPWWGPVWTPMSIALLMVIFGILVARHDSVRHRIWPRWPAGVAALIGIFLALGVFMLDALRVVAAGGGLPEFRVMLPDRSRFPTAWFLLALGLMAVPVADVARQVRQLRRRAGPMDPEPWLDHFERNRDHRPEPDWAAPVTIPAAVLPVVQKSIAGFQLGDGGGPARLIAFNAATFREQSTAMESVVDSWFREEAGHARLLGRLLERIGGEPVTSHWSFTAFLVCRRFLGVAMELQVLTLTELVSTAYYQLLRRHSPDAVLSSTVNLILRDEAGHLSFQRARLRAQGRPGSGLGRALWEVQFRLAGYAAGTVLWAAHAPCLKGLGATRREYYSTIQRLLNQFIHQLERADRDAPQAAAAPDSADTVPCDRNSGRAATPVISRA